MHKCVCGKLTELTFPRICYSINLRAGYKKRINLHSGKVFRRFLFYRENKSRRKYAVHILGINVRRVIKGKTRTSKQNVNKSQNIRFFARCICLVNEFARLLRYIYRDFVFFVDSEFHCPLWRGGFRRAVMQIKTCFQYQPSNTIQTWVKVAVDSITVFDLKIK